MRRWLPLLVVALVSCGGGDDDQASATPRVDLIAAALDAVAVERGDGVELLEVAANLEQVDVIVRDGDPAGADAVLYRYDGDSLTGPIEPRDDDRDTFSAADVAVDPEVIFDAIEDELPDSAIIDLAVHAEGELVVNDATVASENGGVLLVLLQPDGTIIGMQPV